MSGSTAMLTIEDDRSRCWCCGAELPPEAMLRLGRHAEVTICPGCIRFLHRQVLIRSGGVLGPGRRLAWRARQQVVRRGWHRRRGLGPVLRRLGRRF